MRVAVVGSGVAGLTAARTLALAGVAVVVYEKDRQIGGHAQTVNVNGYEVATGFNMFNQVTYPNMATLFDELGAETEASAMSLSISLAHGSGFEWGSSSFAGLAQGRNAINPYFWIMIREMAKFENDASLYLTRMEANESTFDSDETLGEFLQSHGYSQKFREGYLIPVCSSFWSCTSEQVLSLSAVSILTFCQDHHLIQCVGLGNSITVKGSDNYVDKIRNELEVANAKIRISTAVKTIRTMADGKVQLEDANGVLDVFDKCVVALHAPDAVQMLGENTSQSEKRVLGAFQYSKSDIYVHRDKAFMPKSTAAWSSWNFVGDREGKVCVTHWLDQNSYEMGKCTTGPLLVTLNPSWEPEHVEKIWQTSHFVPSTEAANATKRLQCIQGRDGVWYCGAYEGNGSLEDGIKSGQKAAKQILHQKFKSPRSVRGVALSWSEFAAQQAVVAFLTKFIRSGNLRLLGAGGSIFDFVGQEKGWDKTVKKSILRIENPAFYWKIATRADLGLADAFVDGDFSFVGDSEKNNLFNLIQLLIVNRDLGRGADSVESKQSRGWWSPLFATAAVGQALLYFKHAFRNNSLTKARRNIAQHYDLSNDMFSLFLDETMAYSCAIFKGPHDTLKDAQLRKVHSLIDKARIDHTHEVLETGFGWGTLAIEVVRRTGCRYTGITLAKEQLAFAQDRVNKAGLQDRITLLLCDYRTLPGRRKYNRILSCEMVENVGHEYVKEYFARCDYLLAQDGVMVLQTSSLADERYEEYRRSSDFVKEYIFPGCCAPCLNSLTTAMTAGSTLSVEHMENIGVHYHQTLMAWRGNFLSNSSEIMRLGFSEKFIRMWEYYFVYCAAGYQSLTLGCLQLVITRPGNISVFGNPYEEFP